MIFAAVTILAGFLVRADGRWGGVWYLGVLFGALCLTFAPPLTALACAAAFVLFRLPGFRNGGFALVFDKYLPDEQGWQTWPNMFVRGWWTTAIGYGLVSYAEHGNIDGAIYSVPFAAIYMLIYSGGYRWLPAKVLGLERHLWIEHASGWAFMGAIWMS